jgi:hypothetical protein
MMYIYRAESGSSREHAADVQHIEDLQSLQEEWMQSNVQT